MTMGALSGLSVLVTRPQAQAEDLAAYIVEQGGNPLIFPTLAIESLEPVGGWDAVMQELLQADIAIFISANAVREVMPYWQDISPTLQVAAIGRATQAELSQQGVTADWMPMSDYRSEGLLALSVFAQLKDKKITIFTGMGGGRDYLENELAERGAIINKVAVYRRFRPQTDTDILLTFLERPEDKVIVSTSVGSLENLLEMAKNVGDVKSIHLLVISERMRNVAHNLGFSRIDVAIDASSESIIAALKSESQSL